MKNIRYQEPKKVGRPSGYTREIGRAICILLSEGKSLRNILKGIPGVSMSMVMRWLNDDRFREFREQYAHARERQAEVIADEIIDISDEEPILRRETKDGKSTLVGYDNAGVYRNRLRVDARKWMASKLLPKKYGDQIEIGLALDVFKVISDLNGSNGGNIEGKPSEKNQPKAIDVEAVESRKKKIKI